MEAFSRSGWIQGWHRFDILRLTHWMLRLRWQHWTHHLQPSQPEVIMNFSLPSHCRREPFSGAFHPQLHHHQPALHRRHESPRIWAIQLHGKDLESPGENPFSAYLCPAQTLEHHTLTSLSFIPSSNPCSRIAVLDSCILAADWSRSGENARVDTRVTQGRGCGDDQDLGPHILYPLPQGQLTTSSHPASHCVSDQKMRNPLRFSFPGDKVELFRKTFLLDLIKETNNHVSFTTRKQ